MSQELRNRTEDGLISDETNLYQVLKDEKHNNTAVILSEEELGNKLEINNTDEASQEIDASIVEQDQLINLEMFGNLSFTGNNQFANFEKVTIGDEQNIGKVDFGSPNALFPTDIEVSLGSELQFSAKTVAKGSMTIAGGKKIVDQELSSPGKLQINKDASVTIPAGKKLVFSSPKKVPEFPYQDPRISEWPISDYSSEIKETEEGTFSDGHFTYKKDDKIQKFIRTRMQIIDKFSAEDSWFVNLAGGVFYYSANETYYEKNSLPCLRIESGNDDKKAKISISNSGVYNGATKELEIVSSETIEIDMEHCNDSAHYITLDDIENNEYKSILTDFLVIQIHPNLKKLN